MGNAIYWRQTPCEEPAMKWEGREESENVEDRRGPGGRNMAIGGVGGIVVVILALVLGVDPRKLLDAVPQAPPQGAQDEAAPRPVDPKEERQAKFSKVIFHDTEVIWDELFQK